MINRLIKIFLLTVLLLGWASVVQAQQSAQATFDEANEYLESGDYQQAISLYKNLEAQNTVSGALYLNMGISYQRIDSLGVSKYYFLKASKFDETESSAREALEYIESQFSRQSAILPQLPWDIATNWMQENIGDKTLLFIGILLLNIGVLLFVAHWFLQWHPNILRVAGLSAVALSVLVIAASFYTQYVDNRYSSAVMVTDQISVLEQPAEESPVVSRAYEGYTFTVDHYQSQDQPEWSYVRMSNGLYGWIPNSEILIL
ncbi:MAG: hypothetical protein ACQEST_09435 [Bacteroidota bacterium]